MAKALINKTDSTFMDKIYKKTFKMLLSKLKKGRMTITYPDGQKEVVGNTDEVSGSINILDDNFFKRCFYFGDIGFGEAFMHNEWKSPDVKAVIDWMILNVESLDGASGSNSSAITFNLLKITNLIGNYTNKSTKDQAQKNIHYHYDLSNDFFKLMLDETMTYSCGVFNHDDDSLFQSQLNKYELLSQKMKVKESDRVLEVGSGWGGNAIYLAQTYGCKVYSVTISKEQLKYAIENAKRSGVDHLVTFEYKDFRDIEGSFDKIVSIEMIEALGDSYLDIYFNKLGALLKKDGLLGIQAITSPDSRYKSFVKGVDWIQKHIFPGSLLPSVGRMQQGIETQTDLHLVSLIDIGTDYAKTLNIWRENFFRNIDEVKKLGFDDVFINKWNYYLCYCESAFGMKNISDVQVVYSRANNTKN